MRATGRAPPLFRCIPLGSGRIQQFWRETLGIALQATDRGASLVPQLAEVVGVRLSGRFSTFCAIFSGIRVVPIAIGVIGPSGIVGIVVMVTVTICSIAPRLFAFGYVHSVIEGLPGVADFDGRWAPRGRGRRRRPRRPRARRSSPLHLLEPFGVGPRRRGSAVMLRLSLVLTQPIGRLRSCAGRQAGIGSPDGGADVGAESWCTASRARAAFATSAEKGSASPSANWPQVNGP